LADNWEVEDLRAKLKAKNENAVIKQTSRPVTVERGVQAKVDCANVGVEAIIINSVMVESQPKVDLSKENTDRQNSSNFVAVQGPDV
jgi:hypothetical protein